MFENLACWEMWRVEEFGVLRNLGWRLPRLLFVLQKVGRPKWYKCCVLYGLGRAISQNLVGCVTKNNMGVLGNLAC